MEVGERGKVGVGDVRSVFGTSVIEFSGFATRGGAQKGGE